MFQNAIKIMKKVLLLLSISLFLSSCGPSACDCYENAQRGYGFGNLSVSKDCADKYRDEIPESYIGTYKYFEETKRLSRKECND